MPRTALPNIIRILAVPPESVQVILGEHHGVNFAVRAEHRARLRNQGGDPVIVTLLVGATIRPFRGPQSS